MYILYIYPRVRAVGFSMGPNHRMYPILGDLVGLIYGPIIGVVLGLILDPT